jgi:hypothetical protein
MPIRTAAGELHHESRANAGSPPELPRRCLEFEVVFAQFFLSTLPGSAVVNFPSSITSSPFTMT